MHKPISYHTLLFCDLDGTLISRYQPLSSCNTAMIASLNAAGVGVITASGRSPKLLHAVLPPDLPLAAAICSTGTGIMDWRTRNFILKRELTAADIRFAVQYLIAHECSFMIQNPLPDNHRGQYFTARPESLERPDFLRRLRGAPECYTVLHSSDSLISASQLLAVFNPEELPLVEKIRRDFTGVFSAVRATSPIDQQSIWLELFAPGVNKASAAEWLKNHIAPKARCLALGNDYNDCDLMNWADDARMARSAPEFLRRQYGVLSAEPENLLQQAAELWNLLPDQ